MTSEELLVVTLLTVLVPLSLPIPMTLGASVSNTMGSDNDLSTIASSTCQCGVFLLGSPPLQFSADATPTLTGNPVSTNCTSLADRSRCASDCQGLVRAMSNQVNPLLVQTLVLSATKTLVCQKFNASAKVPLPRIHLASPMNWRQHERNMRATDPRWLAGFYRWCDSHWIYAGVSAAEPLCCANGLPVKCQDAATTEETVPNPHSNRNPRLIIKKRPEDDISSEEAELDNDVVPAPTLPTSTEPPNMNDTSMEKVEPFTTPKPEVVESTLNSTILAEAFQFVSALMKSVGMGDVVEGISTVLPTSTATELLKRMDVGGWVSKYQTHYVAYSREFNLGYCYMEYGLYNVANEGVGNLVSRVFGGAKSHRRVRRGAGPKPRAFLREIAQVPPAPAPVETVSLPSAQVKTSVPPTKVLPTLQVQVPGVMPRKKVNATPTATRRQGGNQQGPNLLNMANMLMQVAGAAGGGANNGDGGGDKVNALLQNALPLLGQVATSPMIQGVVSNIVSNFLTPPENNNRPYPQSSSAPPPKLGTGEESNEIEPLPRPTQNGPGRPPQTTQSQDSTGGLGGMLGQIAQTYIKHYFSSKPPPPPPPPSSQAPPKPTKNPDKGTTSTATAVTTQTPAEDKADLVETLSEVAKPFFISYFGVVPGLPGFGQLNIAERTGRLRDDVLTHDPDAGSGITDLIFGTTHLPSTGNSVFDFGNRIVYAFSRANDPTQGMYCMKQYSVNKLWDGFRFGVRTLFK